MEILMSIRKIEDYQIVPETGGGVVCLGTIDGMPWQTTTIVEGCPGQIKTVNGSVYDLGSPRVSMWEMSLKLLRPVKYANLQKCGVL
jgi:hypothetical protein